MHIAFIEDEPELANAIIASLTRSHYAVSHFTTGKDALLAAKSGDVALMILDLGLPDMDGIDVLRVMRKDKVKIPVLVLTARDQLEDKVRGLDAGADDYLAKPFSLDELLARVRVIERRLGNASSSVITHKSITLDVSSHRVQCDNQDIDLGRKQFMLLRALLERQGNVLSKSQLESMMYAWGDEVTSNTIEVHMHNLRKKLPDNFISTIRGVGYTIR